MINKIKITPDKKIIIVYLILITAIIIVYGQVNRHDFVSFDDLAYLVHNTNIQSGINLKSIQWAFSSNYLEFWHPLTWLSLMIDYQFYGLNAGGYHIMNLILHILSTLLLFRLFCRMTKKIWPSAFVAAFFALHPLHVESVAWISERKDVLCAFFWMLTLCLYVYYTEKPIVKRYLLVLFSFALALMSKPMVVTLPLMMMLLDYWPLRRFKAKKDKWILWQLKEKTPFFSLSLVFSVITISARYTPYGEDFHMTLCSRISNAAITLVTYLGKTLWPYDLAVFYPFPAQIPGGQVMGALCLILIMSVLVVMTVQRLPFLFVGWFWYMITIAPVLGIVKVGDFAMADRYHYLPSIGLAVMIGWGIPSLVKSEEMVKKILFPLGIIFLVVMAFITWYQCGYWKNSSDLSEHTLRVTKDNDVAYRILAHALFTEGKAGKAIEYINEAIRINPNYADAYEDRAVFYFKLGHYQRAIENINETIRLTPGSAPRYYRRGNMYNNLGQHQNAIHDYSQAIRLKQDYAEAYNERGGVFFKLGKYQNAIHDYSQAIRLKQDYAEAYNNRGFVYLHRGKKDMGCADARQACALGNCRILEGAKSRGLCR